MDYNWIGNVRELKNLIERGVLTGKGPGLAIKDLGIEGTYRVGTETQAGPEPTFPPIPKKGIDLSSVKEALEISKGNESKAAKLLNMNHHTFRYRRKKLEIE